MSNELREAAEELYKPPFRYERGYIFDANNEMVSDDSDESFALRVRGWGRICYKDNPEQLQDAAGELIAEALTKHWQALAAQDDSKGEAVAVIGRNWQLLWCSPKAISHIAKEHGLKVGSKLYPHPAPVREHEDKTNGKD